MKKIPILSLIFVSMLFFVAISNTHSASAAPVTGFEAGRIIDDSVFTSKSSMGVGQIQAFLNSKVPVCDTSGSQTSEYGGGTRSQWAQAKYGQSTFTCLKDYSENGRSAAQLIYDKAQTYSINPQVLIVLLQKEQGLVTDTWPLNIQYRSATGYGCPDTAPCDSQYYGLTNQLDWAAKMFRAIMNNSPTWYTPYVLGNNFIRYSPNSSCGGTNVNIQNRSTQALYNYTPYQPNGASLAAGYGDAAGDCDSHGNRNFYLYFTDWFGSTKIYDPYGWNLIKTADDSKVYLVVGNTKRWVPSGELFNDWNLGIKAVETVSQSALDAIPTIPPLDRLGYFDQKYYYVDGGKRYWLSTDELQKAWGQYDKLAIAAPAYIALSTIPDGGEATFYASLPSESKVARLIDGQKYMIAAGDADRWQANPTPLTSAAFNSSPVAATLDYHVSVDGQKYLVDNGKMLNVTDSGLLRDYAQNSSTFVSMPSSILTYLRPTQVSPVVQIDNANALFVLRGGNRYYLPTGSHAYAWNLRSSPTSISWKLAAVLPAASQVILPIIVQDSINSKIYLLDGSKHELTGVMANAAKADGVTLPSFTSDYLADVPTGASISSPIIKTRERGDLFTIDGGNLYYIPNGSVLNGLGYPRKYDLADVSKIFTDTYSNSTSLMTMFVKKDSTTYFMQDGNLFPISAGALGDWVANQPVPTFVSQNLTGRFNVWSDPLSNFVSEGNDKYVISNGTAYYTGGLASAYLPVGESWKPAALFGMPRAGVSSDIIQSTDNTDGRILLLTQQGTIQHILTGGSMSAISKQNNTGVTRLSPTLIAHYTPINGGKDVSPLVYSGTQGMKLLGDNGRFYGFPNGDTLLNFIAGGNLVNNLDGDSYGRHNQYVGNVTRLIKDPYGKVYWVEAGKKRWITSGSALQQYLSTPMTSVPWNIIDWMPTGESIQ